ncbi:MAG TPA: zf-HC2 domain-containing protein [Pyrinomonadaceae bacterium]
MKQDTNNEMDLLLRRLSRSASDIGADGNHLDADELSSYAENALPAAARARYTEHLAECASCRKLVAQLSSSVAVVPASESARVSEPSALKKFLASLFSPMVLRYAVPALGLIVVAVIGLTVLRRNERADSVAQLKEQEQSKPAAAQPEQAQTPASATRGYVDSPATTPEARSERSKETQAKETQPAPPPNPAPSASATAEVKQPASPPKSEQQPVANEPAAPKPAAATDATQRSIDEEARKQETQARVEALPRERAYQAGKAENRRADEVAAAGASASPAGSVAKLRRGVLAGAADEKDKNDADTRSVAGRRFRRERGVWTDTAYDSSRSTTNLTRGSEQYRALIADEPAIKTIAEQLDGEIIVVWKGRAYRIR